MTFLVFMGLFFLKHGLLAHVVDFGYSLSRSPSHRLWWCGLIVHCLMEAVVTLCLLHGQPWAVAAVALALEHTALVVSSLVERRASLQLLLQTHVQCELVVLATYVVLVQYVVSAT